LDYTKDTSLAKYGADVVGSYLAQASKEQVGAIDQLGRQLGKGLNVLSWQMTRIGESLGFLNRQMDLQIEQQKLSNVLLHSISNLLRVPDSEKERQHCIETGIKFFTNARHDPDLYADALDSLLKAEKLMKQDYFVLHRIGCIYLYVEKHLDPAKALDYFARAAKYAKVESDPQALRLANVLATGGAAVNAEMNDSTAIKQLAADSFEKAAFAAYVIGNFAQAVSHQSQAVELASTPQSRFVLAKYYARNGEIKEALSKLNQVLYESPLFVAATFREIDLVSDSNVTSFVEQHDAFEVVRQLQEPNEFLRCIIQHAVGITLRLRSHASRLDVFDTAIRELNDLAATVNDATKARLQQWLEKDSHMLRWPLGSGAVGVRGINENIYLKRDEEQLASEGEPFDLGLEGKIDAKKLAAMKSLAKREDAVKKEVVPIWDHFSSLVQILKHFDACQQFFLAGGSLAREWPVMHWTEQERLKMSLVDGLVVVAASDGRISSTEVEFIAATAEQLDGLCYRADGRKISGGLSRVLVQERIKRAVSRIKEVTVTSFAKEVRDALLRYRGTDFAEAMMRWQAALADRDGAVSENESRVVAWFRQYLAKKPAVVTMGTPGLAAKQAVETPPLLAGFPEAAALPAEDMALLGRLLRSDGAIDDTVILEILAEGSHEKLSKSGLELFSKICELDSASKTAQ
jgi:tetratricopeptide (TPR) repeat protein